MSVSAEAFTERHWVDGKRYLWLLSFFYPLAPVTAVALAWATGHGAFFWLPVIVFYTVMPLLDLLVGDDPNNAPDEILQRLDQARYYRYVLYATVPGHFISLIVCAWAVSSGQWSVLSLVGLTLTMGVIGGFAINTGHELGHKRGRLERNLAKLVLTTVGYGHFFIEHNKGHHKDVATPEDPASARMGENIYGFAFTREIPGAARRAWRLEKERLERKGASVWSMDNEIIQTTLGTGVLYGAIVAVFGLVTLPFLIGQTIYGWWQLSFANFIEHYGLLRQKDANGRYQRARPEHSWNTNHIVSNLITFHLQRHSDHHAHPTRWYQTLRHFDGTPQLPTGYPGMYLLAMVPPLWRRVMDRRLLAHYGHDMHRINVDPRQRSALFARHHRPSQ